MATRRRSTRAKSSSFAIRRWRESKAVRRARAAEMVRRLRELYPEAAAELTYKNPFQFLIAVILSAQTTDVTVNRVTPELFRRYPTPQALAAAPQLEVEEVIRQTGFFRSKARARWLQTCATNTTATIDFVSTRSVDVLRMRPVTSSAGVRPTSASAIVSSVTTSRRRQSVVATLHNPSKFAQSWFGGTIGHKFKVLVGPRQSSINPEPPVVIRVGLCRSY